MVELESIWECEYKAEKDEERFQFLEAQNLLTKTASEIQGMKKEINETLHREEVMWNQRSRALWLKCGDRNMKLLLKDISEIRLMGLPRRGFVIRGKRY